LHLSPQELETFLGTFSKWDLNLPNLRCWTVAFVRLHSLIAEYIDSRPILKGSTETKEPVHTDQLIINILVFLSAMLEDGYYRTSFENAEKLEPLLSSEHPLILQWILVVFTYFARKNDGAAFYSVASPSIIAKLYCLTADFGPSAHPASIFELVTQPTCQVGVSPTFYMVVDDTTPYEFDLSAYLVHDRTLSQIVRTIAEEVLQSVPPSHLNVVFYGVLHLVRQWLVQHDFSARQLWVGVRITAVGVLGRMNQSLVHRFFQQHREFSAELGEILKDENIEQIPSLIRIRALRCVSSFTTSSVLTALGLSSPFGIFPFLFRQMMSRLSQPNTPVNWVEYRALLSVVQKVALTSHGIGTLESSGIYLALVDRLDYYEETEDKLRVMSDIFTVLDTMMGGSHEGSALEEDFFERGCVSSLLRMARRMVEEGILGVYGQQRDVANLDALRDDPMYIRKLDYLQNVCMLLMDAMPQASGLNRMRTLVDSDLPVLLKICFENLEMLGPSIAAVIIQLYSSFVHSIPTAASTFLERGIG